VSPVGCCTDTIRGFLKGRHIELRRNVKDDGTDRDLITAERFYATSAETRPGRVASEAARDSIRPSASWGLPQAHWRRRRRVWRTADALLAICLLAGVVIVSNLDHMPQGLTGFLALRLSVKNALLIIAFAWAWPFVLTLCGLHSPSRLRTGDGEWPRLLLAGAVGCLLALVFPPTSRSGLVNPLHAILFGVTVVPAAGMLRASVRTVNRISRRAQPRQVVLVGSGPLAARLYHELHADASQNITIVGYVDSEPHPALGGNGSVHLGGVQDLENILMHHVVDDVFIGLPIKSRYEEIRQSLAACVRVGVPASYSADLFGGGSTPSPSGDPRAPVLSLSKTPSVDHLAAKRAMDLAGALILLLVLAPVMLGIALAIKLASRGPVLFAQERYGCMKRLFRMYKFRTMVAGAERIQEQLEDRNEASGPVFKIREDPRITRLGRFLRRTSLDELPQLWNVLTGDMSLVGPRPLPTRDVGRFEEPWLMRRFSMRPGLTCLWQIGGRSDLDFKQWITLDLEYIDRWSLWLDTQIMLKTIPAVIRGTGAV
jgi:exopolysaccharide biosynthesis polyprenyl glycosylphosphotransferase